MDQKKSIRFIDTCTPKHWRIKGDEYIGSGAFGDVFRACRDKKDCNYIAKIIHYAPSHFEALKREKEDMYQLGNIGLAPHLHEAILCNDLKALTNLIDEPGRANVFLLGRRESEAEGLRYPEEDELAGSPNYAVFFSDFLQQVKPSNIQELRSAVEYLLDQLWKIGIDPDSTSGNILPYRNSLVEPWKVKLVDVGEMTHHEAPFHPSQKEREEKIKRALHEIAKHFS